MSGKKDKAESKSHRSGWLDETSTPQIQAYTEKLGTFLEAMADGKIDKHELKDQEKRVVALMKKVEPELSDELHEEVTKLLCELTAYNIMHTVHDLAEARPKTKFRG
jgi:hypothetical protein